MREWGRLQKIGIMLIALAFFFGAFGLSILVHPVFLHISTLAFFMIGLYLWLKQKQILPITRFTRTNVEDKYSKGKAKYKRIYRICAYLFPRVCKWGNRPSPSYSESTKDNDDNAQSTEDKE